ncbi:MAG: hypothetical protein J5I65_05935 [Aridibacter famidurans]|nr:hypothetical protein [Aridibacter famidurans]
MRTLLATAIVLFGLAISGSDQFAQVTPIPESTPKSPSMSEVRGRVVFADSGLPVRRARVGLIEVTEYTKTNSSIRYEDLRSWDRTLTNDNGEFVIDSIAPGVYVVDVVGPNILSPGSINDFFGGSIDLSLQEIEKHFPLIRLDGRNRETVTVLAKRGGVIAGFVSYEDSAPAIGVEISILRKGAAVTEDELVKVATGRTDDRGYFRITQLFPSDYLIRVVEPANTGGDDRFTERGDFWKESTLYFFYPNSVDLEGAETLNVGWGSDISDLRIVIPKRQVVDVSGFVVDKQTLKPVSNVQLRFTRRAPEAVTELVYDTIAKTGSDGSFSLTDIRDGDYLVRIEPVSRSKDQIPIYAVIDKEISIPGEGIRDLVFELPPTSSVSGVLTVEGNQEIPPLDLYLIDFERKFSQHDTNWKGGHSKSKSIGQKSWDFQISGLSEGTYFWRALSSGRYIKHVVLDGKEISDKIEVAEGQALRSVSVVLSSEPGEFVGRFNREDGTPAAGNAISLIPVDKEAQASWDRFGGGLIGYSGEIKLQLPVGRYFVVVRSRGDSDSEDWIEKSTEGAQQVEIRKGETTHFSMTLPDKH